MAGGGVMGVFDEIWHPAGHRSRIVIEVQDERMVPSPETPGDR